MIKDNSECYLILRDGTFQKLYDKHYQDIEIFLPYINSIKTLCGYLIHFDEEFNAQDIRRFNLYQDLNNYLTNNSIKLLRESNNSQERHDFDIFNNLTIDIFMNASVFDQIVYINKLLSFVNIRCQLDSNENCNIPLLCDESISQYISDLVTWIAPIAKTDDSIASIIFQLIHLGDFGPYIGMRVLFSFPILSEEIIGEIIKQKSVHNTYNERFSHFLSLVFLNCQIFCYSFIEKLILYKSMIPFLIKFSSCHFSINITLKSLTLMCTSPFNISDIVNENLELFNTFIDMINRLINEISFLDKNHVLSVKKLLIHLKVLKIHLENPNVIKIFQILSFDFGVNSLIEFLFSCLLYHEIFVSESVVDSFKSVVSTITVDLDFMEKIQPHHDVKNSNILELQSIIKFLIHLAVNIDISLLCQLLSQYYCCIVSQDIMIDSLTQKPFSTLHILLSLLFNLMESKMDSNVKCQNINVKHDSNKSVNLIQIKMALDSLDDIFEQPQKLLLDWLLSVIFSCELPLQQFHIHVIERYLQSADRSFFNSSIPLLYNILTGKIDSVVYKHNTYVIKDRLTSRALILYLCLFAEYMGIGFIPIADSKNLYIKDIFSIKKLTIQLSNQMLDYSLIYHNLYYLIFNLFPHLFLPTFQILQSIESYDKHYVNNSFDVSILIQLFNANESIIEQFLDYLTNVPWKFFDLFVDHLINLLDVFFSCKLSDDVCKKYLYCWNKACLVLPEKCFPAAALRISKYKGNYDCKMNFINLKFLNSPYLLFDTEASILNNQYSLMLFFDVLRYYMTLFRVHNLRKSRMFKSANRNHPEKIRQFSSLLEASEYCHELAICLIIIFNVESQSNVPILNKSIENIKIISSEFMDEIFTRSNLLVKLLHYHGYPPSSISWLVQYVPSMQTFNNFFQSLLNDVQSPQKLLFLCNVFAHLSKRYPSAAVFANVKLFVATLKQLVTIPETPIDGIHQIIDTFNHSFSFSVKLCSLLTDYINQHRKTI